MLQISRYFTSCILIFIIVIFIQNCNWPYIPKTQPLPQVIEKPDNQDTLSGKIYKINTNQQTCNPSISQDLVNFPACMLWLNFSGNLAVNVPDSMSEYTTVNVRQHDRLTISDTGNNVKWFFFRDALSIPGELQDPEWSTHPDYIVVLGKNSNNKVDGFIIRISDKAYLKFCSEKLTLSSTPHLWLPDSAKNGGVVDNPSFETNGFVKKEHIQQFFGTTNLKLTFGIETQKYTYTIHYIDYNSNSPEPVAIIKPKGKEDKTCESALICPRGNWVAYNCMIGERTADVYIQRLIPGSKPVLVKENAFEPHWWIDPSDPLYQYYIIYNTHMNSGKYVPVDLSDTSFEKDGSAGKTEKQRLIGSPENVPAHMGLKVDYSIGPEVLVSLPFKGGLSRDGRYMSTGYANTYLFKLP